MSNDKKDLTRIEDLSEYLHELEAEQEAGEVPEAPNDEEIPAFDGGDETPDFKPEELNFGTDESTSETTEEDAFALPSSEEGSTDFSGESFESAAFGEEHTEEPAFGAQDFGTENSEVNSHESLSENIFEPTQASTQAPANDGDSDFDHFEETPGPRESKNNIETYKAPENFADVKKFAESSSFTGMGAEGNPSFSVLIKNVRYLEDVNDMVIMLKELGLLGDPEEQVKARLKRGSLLIPRISEYAATFLAHKLRRFDVDLQVGLSDEIHPPKNQDMADVGLVSKFNLYQNQSHHFQFDDPKLEFSQIIVAATPSLEGYQVVRYLGVASEHKMLDGHIVEDESSSEVPKHYHDLAQKLKAHALKANSNAVVGLNYQLTPIPSEYGISSHKYRLTCTGNLVWVNKL